MIAEQHLTSSRNLVFDDLAPIKELQEKSVLLKVIKSFNFYLYSSILLFSTMIVYYFSNNILFYIHLII